MKKYLSTAALTLTLMTASAIADEVTMPLVFSPTILNEGTQRELSKAQIAELLPWAKNSKVFLTDLLENTQGLTSQDKLERLADGIANAVKESAPRNTELFMRYTLNRALVLNDILNKEMDADAVGTIDVKLRVLKLSIEMALKYYATDMGVLSKTTTAPFVLFGIDYFEFLNEINKSIFDASAQYSIQRAALEWFKWDMYRDLKNMEYVSQIVKIQNSLATFPDKKISDAKAITYLRQMKLIANQLNVKEIFKKADLDKKLSVAKTEAEREQIRAQEIENARRLEAAERAEEARLIQEKILTDYRNGKPLPSNYYQKDDLVIHDKKLIRQVEFVSENRQVVLAHLNWEKPRVSADMDNVEKLLHNYQGLKVGDMVFNGNTIREVSGVGIKGTVVLKYISYHFPELYVDSTNISLCVRTDGKLSVGDKVLYAGTVRTIDFMDGRGRFRLAYISYHVPELYVTGSEISKIR